MGFSHTSLTATNVLQHKCDQWACADTGIVRQDSPRASWPQAILKLRPPSSLDYKARHGPQTTFFFYFTLIVFPTVHLLLQKKILESVKEIWKKSKFNFLKPLFLKKNAFIAISPIVIEEGNIPFMNFVMKSNSIRDTRLWISWRWTYCSFKKFQNTIL